MYNPYSLVGDRLKAAREKLGLSQSQVSVMSGIGRSSLAKLESGRRKLDWVEAQCLTRCLGIGYQDLEV